MQTTNHNLLHNNGSVGHIRVVDPLAFVDIPLLLPRPYLTMDESKTEATNSAPAPATAAAAAAGTDSAPAAAPAPAGGNSKKKRNNSRPPQEGKATKKKKKDADGSNKKKKKAIAPAEAPLVGSNSLCAGRHQLYSTYH